MLLAVADRDGTAGDGGLAVPLSVGSGRTNSGESDRTNDVTATSLEELSRREWKAAAKHAAACRPELVPADASALQSEASHGHYGHDNLSMPPTARLSVFPTAYIGPKRDPAIAGQDADGVGTRTREQDEDGDGEVNRDRGGGTDEIVDRNLDRVEPTRRRRGGRRTVGQRAFLRAIPPVRHE
jgi:hypothetical protein